MERTVKYLNYEKNVNVEVVYDTSIDFPAITICNQNFYRYVLVFTFSGCNSEDRVMHSVYLLLHKVVTILSKISSIEFD